MMLFFCIQNHVISKNECLILFQGALMWIPYRRQVLAIDMRFAESLVRQTSMTKANEVSGKMAPCVGGDTRVWSHVTYMMPELKEISQTKVSFSDTENESRL